MNKVDEDKIKKLIHSMALKYNMSDEDMKNLLHSPYEFSKGKINALKLKDVRTEEEFNELKTNFIYPSFFKLIVDWQSMKNRLARMNNINNKVNNKCKK